MGPIVNRSNEHLGVADMMIIKVRQRLIQAAKALRDDGTVPPGVDNSSVYGVRTVTTIIDDGVDWVEATHEHRKAFTDLPVLSAEAQQASARTLANT
jgi:hypothetical protein